MSRSTKRYRNGQRSSIGDEYVAKAVNNIDRAMLKDIAANTPPFSLEEARAMLFRDEDIALLKQAEPLIYSVSRRAEYGLRPNANCTMTLAFEDHPAPSMSAKEFQDDRAGKFLEIVKVIEERRKTWGLVKYVLRWLNSNATPGAIRAMWPSVLQLCPKAPAFAELQHVPSRYSTPPGAGMILQMLRETATTVAFMGMIPDSLEVRPTKECYLTFTAGTFRHEVSDVQVSLDYISIGL